MAREGREEETMGGREGEREGGRKGGREGRREVRRRRNERGTEKRCWKIMSRRKSVLNIFPDLA